MPDFELTVKRLDLQTAEDVAEFLLARGVKGHVADSTDCPIARYLVAEGFFYPSVYDSIGVGWEENFKQARTPAAAREFIDRFDHGAYPELQAGPDE